MHWFSAESSLVHTGDKSPVFSVSREDLASMVAPRLNHNPDLSDFQRRKLIDIRDKNIYILNPEKLVRMKTKYSTLRKDILQGPDLFQSSGLFIFVVKPLKTGVYLSHNHSNSNFPDYTMNRNYSCLSVLLFSCHFVNAQGLEPGDEGKIRAGLRLGVHAGFG